MMTTMMIGAAKLMKTKTMKTTPMLTTMAMAMENTMMRQATQNSTTDKWGGWVAQEEVKP